MPHAVTQATDDMCDDIVTALASRQRDDPTWRWMFGESDDLEQRMTPWLRVWIHDLIKLGDVWCVGDGLGIAVWLPPDDLVDLYEIDARAWPIVVAMAEDPDRYVRFWEWIDNTGMLGGYRLIDLYVHPDHRSQGIGSALVNHGLDMAKREAARTYVVVPTGGSVDYFKRFGFKVAFAGEMPGGGPPAWVVATRPLSRHVKATAGVR
jgi:GNAT superfamily N-acetyltransferase